MAFVRKGEAYPYNLDRPPPPAQHPLSPDGNSPGTSATPPVDAAIATPPEKTNGVQSLPTTINGTGSDLDKLFSKLIPTASPPATPSNGKVTLETLFASASRSTSAASNPASRLVTPPPTTANKSLPLLDSLFASASPAPPGPIPAPTPPFPHHVSSEPFPAPPSAPPSTRISFATAHAPSDISSSEPESSDPPSPTPHAATAAQLILSPQPTTSQLPQILTQDVISALLGMPPSRTSSVASSHRRYEGDVESSDDLHEADSPIDERPKPHANRNKKHELGDVTPRPPLRGFASSEKVMPNSGPTLSSHHSAPAVLPPAATSAPQSVPPVPVPEDPSLPTPATVTVTDTPRTGAALAPRALVPFHADSTLWPYPRAPLDDRDDIVELDFADTSALSDVDAFERQRQNGKNGAKHSKRDRAKEREEIERSWDVPSDAQRINSTNANPSATAAAAPAQIRLLQTPSRTGASSTRATPSPNNLKANHSTPPIRSTPEATASAPSSDKSKSRPNSVANGPKVQVPVTAAAEALAKPAAATAIVEAMRGRVNGSEQAAPTADRTEFVREVLTLIHVRYTYSFHCPI